MMLRMAVRSEVRPVEHRAGGELCIRKGTTMAKCKTQAPRFHLLFPLAPNSNSLPVWAGRGDLAMKSSQLQDLKPFFFSHHHHKKHTYGNVDLGLYPVQLNFPRFLQAGFGCQVPGPGGGHGGPLLAQDPVHGKDPVEILCQAAAVVEGNSQLLHLRRKKKRIR